jgi:hypothetical protein
MNGNTSSRRSPPDKISGRDPHLRPHIGWRAIGNVMAAMGTEGVQSTGEGNRELVK